MPRAQLAWLDALALADAPYELGGRWDKRLQDDMGGRPGCLVRLPVFQRWHAVRNRQQLEPEWRRQPAPCQLSASVEPCKFPPPPRRTPPRTTAPRRGGPFQAPDAGESIVRQHTGGESPELARTWVVAVSVPCNGRNTPCFLTRLPASRGTRRNLSTSGRIAYPLSCRGACGG